LGPVCCLRGGALFILGVKGRPGWNINRVGRVYANSSLLTASAPESDDDVSAPLGWRLLAHPGASARRRFSKAEPRR